MVLKFYLGGVTNTLTKVVTWSLPSEETHSMAEILRMRGPCGPLDVVRLLDWIFFNWIFFTEREISNCFQLHINKFFMIFDCLGKFFLSITSFAACTFAVAVRFKPYNDLV